MRSSVIRLCASMIILNLIKFKNGRRNLMLVTIEVDQWNLIEVFFVTFVHCGSEFDAGIH
jgi:hypothetical protein